MVVKIGIIGCGIGLCYEDKVGCCVICVVDLVDDVMLEICVDCVLVYYNVLCNGLGLDLIDCDDIIVKFKEIVLIVLEFVVFVWKVLNEKCKVGKCILFEGV